MNELKNKLIALCNESGLNIEAVFYVVKDLYRDVIDAYNSQQAQSKMETAENEEQIAEVVED